MDELIKYIWSLREEGMPIHFRRRWDGNKVSWYIWYGYESIAYRANLRTALQAVYAASVVHRIIHESKVKAA